MEQIINAFEESETKSNKDSEGEFILLTSTNPTFKSNYLNNIFDIMNEEFVKKTNIF